jgi:hypothetical protein
MVDGLLELFDTGEMIKTELPVSPEEYRLLLLIDRQADKLCNLQDAYNLSIETDDCKLFKTVRLLGLTPEIDYNSIFKTACEQGKLSILDLLLQEGRVDINYLRGDNGIYLMMAPITIAVINQHLHIVDRLLNEKNNPVRYSLLLVNYSAIKTKNLSIINRLLDDERLDPFLDPDKEMCSMFFHKAILFGVPEIALRILNDERCVTCATPEQYESMKNAIQEHLAPHKLPTPIP